jgi:hypothetical protein
MKNTLSFIVLAVFLGTVSPVLAQMRGDSGGMGQGQTGNGGMRGQHSQAVNMMQGMHGKGMMSGQQSSPPKQ